MSRTFSLGCHKCEVEIWIGQGNDGRSQNKPDYRYIYTSDSHLTSLRDFLYEHLGHPIEFYDDEGSEYKRLGDDDE